MKQARVQSEFANVDKLVARQNYSGASKLLQSIDTSSLTGSELVRWLILKTHTDIYLGIYCTDNINTAIELSRSSDMEPLLAKARLLKGLALDKQGMYRDALQEYLEASVHYRNLGDQEFTAVTVNLLAWTHARVGDYKAAKRNYSESLGLMHAVRERSDTKTLRRKERTIAHNLANLEIQFGRIREGLRSYKDYPISRNELDSDSGRYYFLNRAKAFGLCRDSESCREALQQCKPYLEEMPRELSMYWQWMGLSYQGECCFKDALDCFIKSENVLIEPRSDLLAGIVRWKGECYYYLNQYDRSESCAKKSFDLAIQTHERVEIAASYRLLGMLASARSEFTEAKKQFEEALNLFDSMESLYELAKTQQLFALSGALAVKESQILFNKSGAYFDRERIPRLSEKHIEDILVHMAVHNLDASQRKAIAEILDSEHSN